MRVTLVLLAGMLLGRPAPVPAQSLRGSPWSLSRQAAAARRHDFTRLRRREDVRRFVRLGLLVPLRDNDSYVVSGASFPYARPAVKLFVERLGRQYRRACAERLVVTSLTRPTRLQPRNASHRSVHPTGMAVDLRRSERASCRGWLERVLLSLERRGVVEATRERQPPHYHVAVFPSAYERYVARLK